MARPMAAGTGIASISNATIIAAGLNLGSAAGGVGLLTLQSNAQVYVESNLTVSQRFARGHKFHHA